MTSDIRGRSALPERLETYGEFWPHYLRAHRDRRTRGLHYAGTSLGVLLVLAAVLEGDWRFLIAAPIVGYAFAWIGHFGFEGNKPATFGHPFWSFASDFRMLALCARGRLAGELERAGAQQPPRG
jgi:hypothetical protein